MTMHAAPHPIRTPSSVPPWDDRRVLYVSSIDLGRPGGPANNEREFLAALAKMAGDRLVALIPEPSGNGTIPDCEVVTVPRALGAKARFAIEHSPVGFVRHNAEHARRLRGLLDSRDIGFVVARLNILPLSILRGVSGSCVPLAIKTLGDPLIRGPLGHSGVKGAVGQLVRRAQQPLVTRLLERAVAVDVVTEKLMQLARETYGLPAEKIRVVPNATDTIRFHPADRASARRALGLERFGRIVGYMGGHPSERGARHLVELAPRLLQKHPDLGLVVVGDDPGLAAVKARAEELGIARACHFAGLVPYERVVDYINTFDVGLALDQSARVSTIGNASQKIRQYLACGVPVITPGGDRLPIESEELGSIVDPANLDAVGAAIEVWLERIGETDTDVVSRLRAFAVAQLSVGHALDARIEFWNERLGGDFG